MSTGTRKRREFIASKLARHKPLRVCLGCGGEAKLNYKAGLYGSEITEQTSPAVEVGTKCEVFTFYCAHCFHLVGAFLDLQAALTMWHRCNNPGADNLRLWNEAHQQQIDNKKD